MNVVIKYNDKSVEIDFRDCIVKNLTDKSVDLRLFDLFNKSNVEAARYFGECSMNGFGNPPLTILVLPKCVVYNARCKGIDWGYLDDDYITAKFEFDPIYY